MDAISHLNEFAGIEHDSIQPIQHGITALGHEIVSVAPARSSRVSVVKETRLALHPCVMSTLMYPSTEYSCRINSELHS